MVNARQPAKISRIIDLLNGEYIIKEGWIPNFVSTKLGDISRASIMGVVVSVDNPQNFWLDDATGRILVKNFIPDAIFDFQIGDVVLVIGRPRKYDEQMLIISEIVKRIEDKRWIDFRQEEIKLLLNLKKKNLQENKGKSEEDRKEKDRKETVFKEEGVEKEEKKTRTAEIGAQEEISIQESNYVDYNDLIIKKTRELDSGAGVEIDKLIKNLDFADAEKRINLLLEEGFLFNIKPGKVKVLE